MSSRSNTGVVVIGRNEGDRLKMCLESLKDKGPLVYVDSGSTDGSAEYASGQGAEVVILSTDQPFTAARARNAGIKQLLERTPDLQFVQTVDGDCTVNPSWIASGKQALESDSRLSAVFGRLRERFPDRSIYNKMCDVEWNVPIGPVDSCGGNALHRVEALLEAAGFNEQLIAGEEPDLCLRLRQLGWTVSRIDHEMGYHDAAITHFSQYWRRTVRSGYGYAQHVWIHRNSSFASWKRQIARISFWGIFLPGLQAILCLLAVADVIAPAIAAIPAMIFALQFFRLWFRIRKSQVPAARMAALNLVGKIAEAQGFIKFVLALTSRRSAALIEYKGR
jgi:glycosyltransferase involved in cell wall biosynthesis